MTTKSTINTKDIAIVVGVGLKSESFVELKESLAELEELCYSAGAEVVGSAVQTVQSYHPATLLGTGKVQEIAEMVTDLQATMVVIDHKLSGVQSRNLEKEFNCKVLDRAQLILDIFAQRASTYEGKLQVELAQMLDMMPRQIGAWQGSLSRQAGGIGTRGPGESALEIDRRRIRERIKLIKGKLEKVKKSRSQHRHLRKKQRIPSFALIGYTNTGKSTLLNILTKSDVFAKDQVFATLDPTTRQVHLPELGTAVVTDTVGFIRKLPTHLIEAFKATLEESAEADVLLHVIDLSNPSMNQQIETVQKLIQEFGWDQKPIIYVFNKIDLASPEMKFKIQDTPRVFMSAKTGEGLEKLKTLMIEQCQTTLQEEVELFFPKDQEYKIYELGKESKIYKTEPASQGTLCIASLTPELKSKWSKFLV
ncbi:MAG: GTPase HflX [Bdellovibrionales bacterium]|nr:GTPase HflX [Bdellovibrionales bacterium]